MRFKVLSHAGLLVEHQDQQLLCDPWIIGSTYWRSWWNYPPVSEETLAGIHPDFIYLTHIHWDHFQGATLRRFDPTTPVLIPYDHYDRMKRDLNQLGFHHVIELKHGRPFVLGDDFRLTSYQFSPFTDSAAVIEAGCYTLLNANDAKFMGWPLQQILKRHPAIDFGFRSHSSANARVCHELIDAPNLPVDDNSRYIRSFCMFMARVGPRYAIPFASNSCHLHDDTFAYNDYIQTPALVQEQFAAYKEAHGLATELQVMVTGDSWDEACGFKIQTQDYFVNRHERLLAYKEANGQTLRRQAKIERQVAANIEHLKAFFPDFFKAIPRPVRHLYKHWPIALTATGGPRETHFLLDVYRGEIIELAHVSDTEHPIQIQMPAFILRQAMRLNMFGHAAISKRVKYRATTKAMRQLRLFELLLQLYEYELLPLRTLCRRKLVIAYLRRWREVALYVQLATGMLKGSKVHDLEEKHLQS